MKKMKRKRLRKRRVKIEEESDILSEFVRRLDNRTVPDLECYKEDSGLSLKQYLTRFEEYCSAKFRGKT